MHATLPAPTSPSHDAVTRTDTKDPLAFNGGLLNLYQYVGADPANYLDPSGLLGFHIGGGAGYAIGFIISGGAEVFGGIFVDYDACKGWSIGAYGTKTGNIGIGFYGAFGLEVGVFSDVESFAGLSPVAKIDLALVEGIQVEGRRLSGLPGPFSGAGASSSGLPGWGVNTGYGIGGGAYAGTGLAHTDVVGYSPGRGGWFAR